MENNDENDPVFGRMLLPTKEHVEKIIDSLPDVDDVVREAEEQIENFTKLINSFEQIDVKVRTLWLQVYKNAVTDRKTAYLTYLDLYHIVVGSNENFAIHGDRLSKFLERMEKANAQLMKLAETMDQVAGNLEIDDIPTGKDIFEMIEKNTKNSSKK